MHPRTRHSAVERITRIIGLQPREARDDNKLVAPSYTSSALASDGFLISIFLLSPTLARLPVELLRPCIMFWPGEYGICTLLFSSHGVECPTRSGSGDWVDTGVLRVYGQTPYMLLQTTHDGLTNFLLRLQCSHYTTSLRYNKGDMFRIACLIYEHFV